MGLMNRQDTACDDMLVSGWSDYQPGTSGGMEQWSSTSTIALCVYCIRCSSSVLAVDSV